MKEHLVSKQVAVLLQALSCALQEANLWSECPPSKRAMSSTAPFACDTMCFENWLQFIFIPKMEMLLVNNDPLPSNIAILPMAEEMLSSTPAVNEVVRVIAQLDEVLSIRQ